MVHRVRIVRKACADALRLRTGRCDVRVHNAVSQRRDGRPRILESTSARGQKRTGALFWADVVGVNAGRATHGYLLRVQE